METTNTTAVVTMQTLIDLFMREAGRVTRHHLSLGDREIFDALTASGIVAEGIASGVIAATERGFRLVPKIGMGATLFGYSDRHPYEIVAVSPSGKQITLRAMRAEADPTWKPEWVAGGFAGTVVNQNEQRWIIESDPQGAVIKAHLHKDGYYHHGSGTVTVGKAWRFYDYNF